MMKDRVLLLCMIQTLHVCTLTLSRQGLNINMAYFRTIWGRYTGVKIVWMYDGRKLVNVQVYNVGNN